MLVSLTSALTSPTALAVRRRGLLAPRISRDSDAVLQILVPQRSRPRLHVDEPRFPVCISSHGLPLQYSPLLRDGREWGGKWQNWNWSVPMVSRHFSCWSFKLLTKSQCLRCLMSLAPHTFQLFSPKISELYFFFFHSPYPFSLSSTFLLSIIAGPFLILCSSSYKVVKYSLQ